MEFRLRTLNKGKLARIIQVSQMSPHHPLEMKERGKQVKQRKMEAAWPEIQNVRGTPLTVAHESGRKEATIQGIATFWKQRTAFN